jgi:hypothetical protein
MSNFVADLIIQKITFEMKEGSNIVHRLHKKGYNEVFEASSNLLKCVSNGYYYQIEDFTIDELYNLKYVSGILKGLYLFALRHNIEAQKGIFIGMLD